MNFIKYIILIFLVSVTCQSFAQTNKDTTVRKNKKSIQNTQNQFTTADSVSKYLIENNQKILGKHQPSKATIRSLILPGWGQAYNKRYWEIPIVYGALGVTGAIYLYNNKWYKRTRDAYDIRVNRPQDSSLVNPKLAPLSPNSLQVYRNSFRRDRDYSALWFIIFWGLNIADATVFAHLKEFDVSEDLSLKVNPIINANGSKGIGLALGLKNSLPKERKYVMP